MASNAEKLYQHIQKDSANSQALFRQALQDPQGALEAICALGKKLDLPVTVDEVKTFLADLDDADTKQWLIKARGGL